MSKTIGVLNPKGGSGKTTLATNLARSLQLEGHEVLIVDTDPQGTARDWRARQADDSGLPGVIGIEDIRTLTRELRRLGSSYDFVIIDGSAKIENLMGAAVKASDVVLIPVRPSPADLWAVGDLVEVVRARQEITDGDPPAAFVVSSAIVGTNLSEQVTEALQSYELPTLEGRTCQRIVYAESMITGSTVVDEDKGGKAAAEIEAITRDTLDLLNSTY